jgi:hypothetical protein
MWNTSIADDAANRRLGLLVRCRTVAAQVSPYTTRCKVLQPFASDAAVLRLSACQTCSDAYFQQELSSFAYKH